jgi:hypothetical protein
VKASLAVPYRLDRKVRSSVKVQEKVKDLVSPIRGFNVSASPSFPSGIHVWLDRDVYFPGERRGREVERQRGREAERQRGREAERQRGIEADRQIGR